MFNDIGMYHSTIIALRKDRLEYGRFGLNILPIAHFLYFGTYFFHNLAKNVFCHLITMQYLYKYSKHTILYTFGYLKSGSYRWVGS